MGTCINAWHVYPPLAAGVLVGSSQDCVYMNVYGVVAARESLLGDSADDQTSESPVPDHKKHSHQADTSWKVFLNQP